MQANRRQALIQVVAIGLGLLWIGVGIGAWAWAQSGRNAATSALVFEPTRLSLGQGATAAVNVTVALKSGTSSETRLNVADLPSGLAVTFEPSSGDPTFTSTMRVKASPTTTPGTYGVRVQAVGGTPSGIVSYAVTVEKTGGY